MPGKGYSTVGMKPIIVTRLQEATDRYYPGMFLPSTLIIMMNEVKMGYYSVENHDIRLDLSGSYNTITLRSDVQQWLEENYEQYGEEYEAKYRVKSFTKFVSYFIVNMLESKYDSRNNYISIKESNFKWLQEEYRKQKNNVDTPHEIPSFERFLDVYINNLFGKIKAAKEILTL